MVLVLLSKPGKEKENGHHQNSAPEGASGLTYIIYRDYYSHEYPRIAMNVTNI